MRAHDIERLTTITALELLPSQVIAATNHPSLDADDTVGQLAIIDLATGAQRPLTLGHHDYCPRLSPNGASVAFLRRTPEDAAQVWVIPTTGGEARCLTSAPLGVADLRWAPDGSRLVISARRPEAGRYGTIDGLGADRESPRRIRSANWRVNGVGHLQDRPMSLALVTVPDLTAPPRPRHAPGPERWNSVADETALQWIELPPGEWSDPAFSPDGRSILAIADAHSGRDNDLCRDLYRIDLASGELDNLTALHAHAEVLAFAEFEDHIAIAFRDLGERGRNYVGTNVAIGVVGPGSFDIVTDAATSDIGFAGGVFWAGAHHIVSTLRTRGTVVPVLVDLRSGAAVPLIDGEIGVTALGWRDGRLVVAAETTTTSAEVMVVDDGVARSITSEPMTGLVLARPQDVTVEGRDGYQVHGWVTLPAGPGPHPVILTVHGGPFGQYSPTLNDETQVLVEAGYAVVMCNPRGSAGYGQLHGRAIRGRLGTDDYHDVLDFLDGSLARFASLDTDRLGIMGGSYGGFLTAWIVGHDHRFRGAIAERGWFDPAVFTGTSDIGSFYADEYVGTTADDIARQSPQAVAHLVRTPTLIIHSENDLRCPIGQSEAYYTALHRAGVDTELVVFPGENHELTRSGHPRHRAERFEIVLDWWAKMLPSTSHLTSIPNGPPASNAMPEAKS